MDESRVKEHKQLAKGIAASPGAASGIAFFDVKKAIELGEAGKKVILVRKAVSYTHLTLPTIYSV